MALRDMLKSPTVYQLYQKLVGGTQMRSTCLSLLAPQAGERILDIGCGPAYYLDDMPQVDYHGFDTDAAYITHARARFGHRATFYCELFTAEHAARLGQFDGVFLMGLLHHLNDAECRATLALVAGCLKPEGRVIALDTTVHQAQNPLEHLIAVKDRGEYVRRPEQFEALARESFRAVEGSLTQERLIPSVYWTMSMRSPINAGPADPFRP